MTVMIDLQHFTQYNGFSNAKFCIAKRTKTYFDTPSTAKSHITETMNTHRLYCILTTSEHSSAMRSRWVISTTVLPVT